MQATGEPLLRANDISKTVPGPDGPLQILDGVDLAVAQGASLAIVGASGSGKTTLLGLLAGLDTPTRGEVVLAGERLGALDEEGRAALRRRLVGFVFQSFHLLPALTAEENVMLPLELDGRAEARRPARDALDAVGLAHRLHHYPHQLSGGEQQRVALARALVNEPEILLADEPTGNLDPELTLEIMDLIAAAAMRGTTVVVATHDHSLIERYGKRWLRLEGGRIAEDLPATAGVERGVGR